MLAPTRAASVSPCFLSEKYQVSGWNDCDQSHSQMLVAIPTTSISPCSCVGLVVLSSLSFLCRGWSTIPVAAFLRQTPPPEQEKDKICLQRHALINETVQAPYIRLKQVVAGHFTWGERLLLCLHSAAAWPELTRRGL